MERPKRKLAISGSGLNSCYAIGHFLKYSAAEIEWYIHDQDESFQLAYPNFVEDIYGHFNFIDKIIHNPVTSLNKIGCGTVHKSFSSKYAPSRHGYIIDSKSYRDVLIKHIQKQSLRVVIKEQLETHDIDCDYILDFTNKDLSDKVTQSKYSASKKVIRFNTKKINSDYQFIVRPHGYIVLTPLNNIFQGLYYYDDEDNELILNDICSFAKEGKHDDIEILSSENVGSFYRTQNFIDRVVYNGAASFSLENIETANLSLACYMIRCAFDYFYKVLSAKDANNRFCRKYKEIERITMLHFAADNKFQLSSNYWKHAKWLAWQSIEELSIDPDFHRFSDDADRNEWYGPKYGHWSRAEYIRNVENLGLPINIEKEDNGNN